MAIQTLNASRFRSLWLLATMATATAAESTKTITWVPGCSGVFQDSCISYRYPDTPLFLFKNLSFASMDPPTTNIVSDDNNLQGSFALDLSQPGSVTFSLDAPNDTTIVNEQNHAGDLITFHMYAEVADKPTVCENPQYFNSSQMNFTYEASDYITLESGYKEFLDAPEIKTFAKFDTCGIYMRLHFDMKYAAVSYWTRLAIEMELTAPVTTGNTLYTYQEQENYLDAMNGIVLVQDDNNNNAPTPQPTRYPTPAPMLRSPPSNTSPTPPKDTTSSGSLQHNLNFSGLWLVSSIALGFTSILSLTI